MLAAPGSESYQPSASRVSSSPGSWSSSHGNCMDLSTSLQLQAALPSVLSDCSQPSVLPAADRATALLLSLLNKREKWQRGPITPSERGFLGCLLWRRAGVLNLGIVDQMFTGTAYTSSKISYKVAAK